MSLVDPDVTRGRCAEAKRDCISCSARCLLGTQHGCTRPAPASISNSGFMLSCLADVGFGAQPVDELLNTFFFVAPGQEFLDPASDFTQVPHPFRLPLIYLRDVKSERGAKNGTHLARLHRENHIVEFLDHLTSGKESKIAAVPRA